MIRFAGGSVFYYQAVFLLDSESIFRHASDYLPKLSLNVLPSLKQQEIPLDHSDSCNMFRPGPNKPLVATPAAIELYSHEVIMGCWQVLHLKAEQHDGLDYLQVFEDKSKPESLWFIEDGPGGAITALLPSDY